MGEENTAYYVAAGRSLAAVEEWVTKREVNRVERGKLSAEIGTDQFWAVRESLLAAIFEPGSTIPPGLTQKKGTNRYYPNRRSLAGRMMSRRFDSLRCPDHFGVDDYVGDGRWHTPGICKMAGKWIISHHVKAEPPLDAIPLKRSEFWRMKEESEGGAS